MKKAILKSFAIGMVVIGFVAMKEIDPPSISGKITPADAVENVWIIQSADSLKATLDANGAFKAEVKPGTWKVFVDAKAPFQDAEISELIVTEEKNTDVGEISLKNN